MRIVFMGTPEFAIPSLQAILDAGHDVPLVVSTPDRMKGRGLVSTPSAIKAFAVGRGIPVSTPEGLKEPDFIDAIRLAAPELICVVAFRILPAEVYTVPPLGSFNLHGSLLPKYRGAAPINRAIINGERETGVTTFFLQRRVDTGEMIMQRSIAIRPEMTAGELHDEMMHVGAEVVAETLRRIESGSVVPLMQDDTLATPAPKIFREDCRIDWERPADRLHDLVRGLSPYPGAFTYLRGKALKIYRTRMTDRDDVGPGTLAIDEGRVLVGTSTTALEVLELQQEGRKAMTAGEFHRGHILQQGERMTDASITS